MASNIEEKICRVVVEDLVSSIEGSSFKLDKKPDQSNRSTKDVDYSGKSADGKKIAIEHTSIDSFSDQRGMSAVNATFVQDIQNRIQSSLPADHYLRLILPSDFLRHLHSKKRKQLLAIISDWIKANVGILLQCKDNPIHIIVERKTIELHYGGSIPKLNGRVILVQKAPSKIEKERKRRMRTALREKLPKLSRYKWRKHITVLALEDPDYALSDWTYVEKSLSMMRWLFLMYLPTYIVYVRTYKSDIQEIWLLKCRKRWFATIRTKGPYILNSGVLTLQN